MPADVRPLVVQALCDLDVTRGYLTEVEAEIVWNATMEERRMAMTLRAHEAELLASKAAAIKYACDALAGKGYGADVTLRQALDRAPVEVAETVARRLRDAGFDCDWQPPGSEP